MHVLVAVEAPGTHTLQNALEVGPLCQSFRMQRMLSQVCITFRQCMHTYEKESSFFYEYEVNLSALCFRAHVSANRDADMGFDAAGDGSIVVCMWDRRLDGIVTSPPCTNALDLLVGAKRSPASGSFRS